MSVFIGQYSAVPPPQATQTKKGPAKAPAKKAESSDSSDSSDEAERVPPKGGAGKLWGDEAAEEVLHGAENVLAMSWFPWKSRLTLVYVPICFSGSFE